MNRSVDELISDRELDAIKTVFEAMDKDDDGQVRASPSTLKVHIRGRWSDQGAWLLCHSLWASDQRARCTDTAGMIGRVGVARRARRPATHAHVRERTH
jgi:hypothetical protein